MTHHTANRILFILILSLTFLFNPPKTYAQTPENEAETCNEFERIQSILLSEGTRQSFETKLEMARVIVTKGVCFLDPGFYTGYGVALNVLQQGSERACINNTHCKAYFMLYSIDSAVRESAALAAHVALTENPRVPRYHFDNYQSTAYWWDSPRACPDGWWVSGEIKYC